MKGRIGILGRCRPLHLGEFGSGWDDNIFVDLGEPGLRYRFVVGQPFRTLFGDFLFFTLAPTEGPDAALLARLGIGGRPLIEGGGISDDGRNRCAGGGGLGRSGRIPCECTPIGDVIRVARPKRFERLLASDAIGTRDRALVRLKSA